MGAGFTESGLGIHFSGVIPSFLQPLDHRIPMVANSEASALAASDG
jgi:hypothetical protein